MIEDYGEHSLVKTRAYEGVPELVRALRARRACRSPSTPTSRTR